LRVGKRGFIKEAGKNDNDGVHVNHALTGEEKENCASWLEIEGRSFLAELQINFGKKPAQGRVKRRY